MKHGELLVLMLQRTQTVAATKHFTLLSSVAKALVLQFWELDNDHDFLISKEDLIRYGNHSLTYRIVERVFQQVSWNSSTPSTFTHMALCEILDPKPLCSCANCCTAEQQPAGVPLAPLQPCFNTRNVHVCIRWPVQKSQI